MHVFSRFFVLYKIWAKLTLLITWERISSKLLQFPPTFKGTIEEINDIFLIEQIK
jgi:uncharacterized protein YecE (DUF72 family)